MTPLARGAYVLVNLGKNALAPVARRLGHQPPLGMDGRPDVVKRTLNELADGLMALGGRLGGRDVLELGPGRTPQVTMAFALAGARRALALDTSLRIPRSWDDPSGIAALAELLAGPHGERFRTAVGANVASVRGRAATLAGEEHVVAFKSYDGVRIPFPDGSFDLIVSKSVLEHVAASNVGALVDDMRRVLRPGGAMVHLVDLRDHMWIAGDRGVTGDWLEALRYPQWLYSAMFSNRSTSINRLRACQWRKLFEAAGFEIVRWHEHLFHLPTGFSRDLLQEPWRTLDERELSIGGLEVAARVEGAP